MLRRLHIEHELGERAVHAGDAAFHEGEAGAGEFGASVSIQAQRLAHVHMVFDGEIKGFGSAPAAHFDVVSLACTDRHALVRQIGQGHEQGLQLGGDGIVTRRRCFQLGFDRARLGHHSIDALAFGFEHANRFGERISLVLQLFRAHLDGFALSFHSRVSRDIEVRLRIFALLQRSNDRIEVFAEGIRV